MFTLATISIFLVFIGLVGWTLGTYFLKKDSREVITAELKTLFDICKKFFISLINLVKILTTNSVVSVSDQSSIIEKTLLNDGEKALSLVKPVKEIERPNIEITQEEEDDTALSSFSQEVIEVINEEEEKVA